jgi:hypothetical protein
LCLQILMQKPLVVAEAAFQHRISRKKPLRPFSSLHLKPYFWLQASDQNDLHKIYLSKSLELHPDKIKRQSSSQDNQALIQKAEQVYSELNADYQDLKSTEKLILRVIHDQLDTPESHTNQKPKNNLAPDLALEYFEVTEDPTPEKAQALERKILDKIKTHQENIEQIAKNYPYSGVGEAKNFTFNNQDLLNLKTELAQKKYLSNILIEMNSKIGL